MNNTLPTAEEILTILIPHKPDVSDEENLDSIKQNSVVLTGWLKLYLQAQLEAILENAKTIHRGYGYIEVDLESIENAYPLDNIK
jgi:radical SAM superfamily enzyme